jgi:hypothetical protein
VRRLHAAQRFGDDIVRRVDELLHATPKGRTDRKGPLEVAMR